MLIVLRVLHGPRAHFLSCNGTNDRKQSRPVPFGPYTWNRVNTRPQGVS